MLNSFICENTQQWLTFLLTSCQQAAAPGAGSSWTCSGNCNPVLQSSHNLQGDGLLRSQNSWLSHHHYSPAKYVIRLGQYYHFPFCPVAYIKAVSIIFFPNCQIIHLEELLGCPEGEVNECMLMCFRTNQIHFQLIMAKLGYQFACFW
jgi:hypothetical protein